MDVFVATPKKETHSSKTTSKKVAFNRVKRCKRIRHRSRYSESEHDATWYTNEQLREVLNDCIVTCRMMMSGEMVLEDEGFCTRGLEYKTPSGSQFRKASKAKAVDVVLSEAALQKESGVEEPEYLALIYSFATKENRRLAHLMALRDQEEALIIHENKNGATTPKAARGKKKMYTRSSSVSSSPASDSDYSDSSLRVDDDKTVFIVGYDEDSEIPQEAIA